MMRRRRQGKSMMMGKAAFTRQKRDILMIMAYVDGEFGLVRYVVKCVHSVGMAIVQSS